MKTTAPLIIALAILLASCASDSTESSVQPTVRDSAGVTIVENVGPELTGDAAWRLTDPEFTIGGVGTDPDAELYRVASGIRLDDGRIVIANAGTSEIRFYDADGTLLNSAGAQGGGPGEFQALSTVRRYGSDSLVAFDSQQRRMTFYDLEGNLGRMTTVTPNEGTSLPFLGATFGVFADGTFFFATIDPFSGGPQSGATRGSEPAFHVSETGTFLDRLGTFPGREVYVEVNARGARATTRIFGYSTFYAVAAGQFFAGTNDRHEIARYTSAGSLEMLIRTNRDPVPVRSDHRDLFMERRTADMSTGDRIAYEERYDGNEPPSTFPAYGEMLTDRDGNLWVSRYLPPDESDDQFSVFNSDGHWVTDVDVPDDISVMEIGPNYVLALWTNDLDVEHVRLFGLERN